MSDVAIVATTYFPPGDVGVMRAVAAARTFRSWLDGFEGASLRLVVADDGSEPAYFVGFERWKNIDIVRTPRLGTGGALNAGLRHVFANDLADVVFYGADDWYLGEPLDLAPSLALLRRGDADVVRLGPTHPNIAASVLRTDISGAEWCLNYNWAVGGYVFGHRPALHHRRMYENNGYYIENASAIEVEREYNERVSGKIIVMHAPNCTLAGPFRHIDTTELGEDDPATLTARYATSG